MVTDMVRALNSLDTLLFTKDLVDDIFVKRSDGLVSWAWKKSTLLLHVNSAVLHF